MSRDEIIGSLRRIMEKYSAHISEAWLFGSFGRGDYHRTSDIDVAISCDDWRVWFDILDDIEEIDTIRRFDVHDMSDGGFAFDMGEIRNGVRLY